MMKERNKNILSLPKIKFTLANDKNNEANRNLRFSNFNEDVLTDEMIENEWAQEYYLIYNSHEMLYRNDA